MPEIPHEPREIVSKPFAFCLHALLFGLEFYNYKKTIFIKLYINIVINFP